ncbi:glycoside hydrolase family 31 protein [Psychrosphaera sp. 1_MG-2023]|uniref:glycoside hydrolase family 31 protein n=1 Tax=Psychrosphaera sp. 1_MG-2023 TaxID=3062643 RepID=UPI0026E309DF|nr:TIM-barrel domain-containing protein [Psychrosphaera sp. 1_MG-2023]MDO6719440.1 glycoside hydrolase family 31 protein [Psychrosphaera sp. 1_MG-2023]
MRSNIFWLFIVIFSTEVVGNELVSWRLHGQSLELKTKVSQVTLTALTQDAIEVLYDADEKQIPSFAIDYDALKQNPNLASDVSVVEKPGQLLFTTAHMRAVVQKVPFGIRFEYKNNFLFAEETGFFNEPGKLGFRFRLQPGELLMGGGERVLGMNRRGHRLPLYNRAHYGYGTESKQMNFSIPAVVSSRKYTLLFDNTANGWMDLGHSQSNVLQFEATGGRKAYVVIGGTTYPNLLQHYVGVTGKQPLPPRWAFGNHASRFGYRNQNEVLETIALFREKRVPVDSIILDLYWFGAEIKGHMGNLDWDDKTFPAPESMISTLKQNGVNTVLITEPFILTSSKKWTEANENRALATDLGGKQTKTFDFFFGNTGLIDVFKADAQVWFGNVYKRLAAQGVTGVWGDLGEPEVHPKDMLHTLSNAQNMQVTANEIHNVYGHQWADLVTTALTEYDDNGRPFMIMRSGFAGSQRFGMIPWTGDVSRSWDGLKPQIELTLQMSLLGMAYTHSDLGGFAGGDTFDKEMYIRWLQYGVFQPIYRPHAQDNIAPEPIFHDEQTVNIIRESINLRYKLLPYNYTLAYENTTTGMPLMRPMFFGDEQNFDLLKIKDQYFWGDSFLVKPITDPGVTRIPIILPPGIWFDFWNDKPFKGAQTINYQTALSTIPVLVRAGSIIPSVELIQTTKDYSSDALQLDYYFHPSVTTSQAKMYEDDGLSANAIATKQFELLQFSARIENLDKTPISASTLTFTLAKSNDGLGYKGAPMSREVTLVIHNWQTTPKQVEINGVLANFADYDWDQDKSRLTVKIAKWAQNNVMISVR